jgi:hypothetical protein
VNPTSTKQFAVIAQQISRLNAIMSFPDTPAPLRDFDPSELPQALLRVARLPSIGALTAKGHALNGFPCACVDHFSVVELLQDAVVSASLDEVLLGYTFLWMELTHRKSIVDVTLRQLQLQPLAFSGRTIGQLNLAQIADRTLDLIVDIPAHSVHKRSPVVLRQLLIVAIELTTGLVVCRSVALLTDGHQF